MFCSSTLHYDAMCTCNEVCTLQGEAVGLCLWVHTILQDERRLRHYVCLWKGMLDTHSRWELDACNWWNWLKILKQCDYAWCYCVNVMYFEWDNDHLSTTSSKAHSDLSLSVLGTMVSVSTMAMCSCNINRPVLHCMGKLWSYAWGIHTLWDEKVGVFCNLTAGKTGYSQQERAGYLQQVKLTQDTNKVWLWMVLVLRISSETVTISLPPPAQPTPWHTSIYLWR